MVQASIGVVRVPLPFTAMGRGAKGSAFLVDYFGKMVPVRREGSGEDMFSQICRPRDDDGEYMSVEALVDQDRKRPRRHSSQYSASSLPAYARQTQKTHNKTT